MLSMNSRNRISKSFQSHDIYNNMERRDAIKYTALFMGAGMSASTIAAIMSGCTADTSDGWTPAFLTLAEAEFIDELGETIMPKTETPGAKDARVVRFIDAVRPLRFSAEDNTQFKSNLQQFMDQSASDLGKEFVKVSPEKRLEWVTAKDKAAYEFREANKDLPDNERPFYLVLKEHIAGGFFNSEIVAKEFFAFDPNPGRYDACIPYAQIGRDWAL